MSLFILARKIFSNATEEKFRKYVTFSDADKTYMMLYENSEGEIVGFFALHLYKVERLGKKRLIFRGQTGLLKEYRRKRANMYFTLFVILKYRLLYPFRSIYCYLAVLSPSMYCVLARSLAHCLPRYDKEPSQHDYELAHALKKDFAFDDDPDGHEWLTPVGWVSLATEREKEYWRTTENPHIKFYLEKNPHFQQGMGLVTLIPFSWSNILLSSIKVLRYILRKKFR